MGTEMYDDSADTQDPMNLLAELSPGQKALHKRMTVAHVSLLLVELATYTNPAARTNKALCQRVEALGAQCIDRHKEMQKKYGDNAYNCIAFHGMGGSTIGKERETNLFDDFQGDDALETFVRNVLESSQNDLEVFVATYGDANLRQQWATCKQSWNLQ